MSVPVEGYAHVRLTVTDIDRSRSFYDEVLGLDVAVEMPDAPDEATREQFAFLYGGVIYALPDGSLLGLRPVAPSGDAFDPDRTGLDHLSLRVADRDVLDDAARQLDDLGVEHGGVQDAAGAVILAFWDPDGNALELTCPG